MKKEEESLPKLSDALSTLSDAQDPVDNMERKCSEAEFIRVPLPTFDPTKDLAPQIEVDKKKHGQLLQQASSHPMIVMSLIGPVGTGKSFLAAELISMLHQHLQLKTPLLLPPHPPLHQDQTQNLVLYRGLTSDVHLFKYFPEDPVYVMDYEGLKLCAPHKYTNQIRRTKEYQKSLSARQAFVDSHLWNLAYQSSDIVVWVDLYDVCSHSPFGLTLSEYISKLKDIKYTKEKKQQPYLFIISNKQYCEPYHPQTVQDWFQEE
jgi:hypothetical protein